MQKIKVKDEVIVTTGRDKGKRGAVTRVYDDGRVLVSGINLVKKHVKPNPQVGEQGGIQEKSVPLDISNVAILNPATNKADRVGIKVQQDGKPVRVYKSDGKLIDKK
jgi:large subunit ribosomal protein L24